MSEWISVKDKKPTHMKEIRVMITPPNQTAYEREKNAVYLSFTGDIYDAEEQETLHYVTHWMPLPEPPKE